jgi:hypothetical protein
MRTNWSQMWRLMVWLGITCVSLTATSLLSSPQPKLRATLKGHIGEGGPRGQFVQVMISNQVMTTFRTPWPRRRFSLALAGRVDTIAETRTACWLLVLPRVSSCPAAHAAMPGPQSPPEARRCPRLGPGIRKGTRSKHIPYGNNYVLAILSRNRPNVTFEEPAKCVLSQTRSRHSQRDP